MSKKNDNVTINVNITHSTNVTHSREALYSLLEFIGEGCFGKVAKCQNLTTKETVAVKILKKGTDFIQDTEKEIMHHKLFISVYGWSAISDKC
uniref:Protein kinase domain-containing protein n=2 Tax=Lates calcarifer TaxID=8187 RepID=A0A4W6CYK9_LATCA